MIVFRDFKMKEDDQWKKDVKPKLERFEESVPLFDVDGKMVAWKIQHHFD